MSLHDEVRRLRERVEELERQVGKPAAPLNDYAEALKEGQLGYCKTCHQFRGIGSYTCPNTGCPYTAVALDHSTVGAATGGMFRN